MAYEPRRCAWEFAIGFVVVAVFFWGWYLRFPGMWILEVCLGGPAHSIVQEALQIRVASKR